MIAINGQGAPKKAKTTYHEIGSCMWKRYVQVVLFWVVEKEYATRFTRRF